MSTNLVEDIVLASDEVLANLKIDIEDLMLAIDNHDIYVYAVLDDGNTIFIDEVYAILGVVLSDDCVLSDDMDVIDNRITDLDDLIYADDIQDVTIYIQVECDDFVNDIEDENELNNERYTYETQDVIVAIDDMVHHIEINSELTDGLRCVDELHTSCVYIINDEVILDDETSYSYYERISVLDWFTATDEAEATGIRFNWAVVDDVPVMQDALELTGLVIGQQVDCAILVRDELVGMPRLAYSVRDFVRRLEI